LPVCDKILLLGGTEDAYNLAEQLYAQGFNFISSLAGRTHQPRLPKGAYRIGGFTPEGGLPLYIKRHTITMLIDATHPYAAQISRKAQAAAAELNIPYLRLERPLWQKQQGDIWRYAADEAEAANLIPPKARAFLALGRQHLSAFSERSDCIFFARIIEPPETLPDFQSLRVILGRPQTEAEEISFMRSHNITCLICRNSGSRAAYGKIAAARALRVSVILIQRPQIFKNAFPNADSVMNYLLGTKG